MTRRHAHHLAGRHVLITGGAGFLGSAVTEAWLRYLHPSPSLSTVYRRAEVRPLPAPHRTIYSDVSNTTGFTNALLEAEYVIWIASCRDHGKTYPELIKRNVDPIRSAMEVLKASARLVRFVYVSTISAVDQDDGTYRPLRDDSRPRPRTAYGRSKLLAERVCLEAGVPITVLRLPFLYGPSFRRSSFLSWYRAVAANPMMSSLQFTATLSLLFTGDVGMLLCDVLRPEQAAAADASPFFVSDGCVYRVDDLVTLVAGFDGRSRPAVRCPKRVSHLVSALLAPTRFHYWRHAAFSPDYFVVDSSRFRDAFQPTFTGLEEGLRKTFGRPIATNPFP